MELHDLAPGKKTKLFLSSRIEVAIGQCACAVEVRIGVVSIVDRPGLYAVGQLADAAIVHIEGEVIGGPTRHHSGQPVAVVPGELR